MAGRAARLPAGRRQVHGVDGGRRRRRRRLRPAGAARQRPLRHLADAKRGCRLVPGGGRTGRHHQRRRRRRPAAAGPALDRQLRLGLPVQQRRRWPRRPEAGWQAGIRRRRRRRPRGRSGAACDRQRVLEQAGRAVVEPEPRNRRLELGGTGGGRRRKAPAGGCLEPGRRPPRAAGSGRCQRHLAQGRQHLDEGVGDGDGDQAELPAGIAGLAGRLRHRLPLRPSHRRLALERLGQDLGQDLGEEGGRQAGRLRGGRCGADGPAVGLHRRRRLPAGRRRLGDGRQRRAEGGEGAHRPAPGAAGSAAEWWRDGGGAGSAGHCGGAASHRRRRSQLAGPVRSPTTDPPADSPPTSPPDPMD